jgi:dsDNA-specific endonuclease/ATPase MutS2
MSDLKSIIRKVLKENRQENYMFFSNLKQMRRQIDKMLEMNPEMVDQILQNGHDWADDHISEAKNNMDQVFDFLMNETTEDTVDIEYEMSEGKKKNTELCSRGIAAAKAKYDVYPSAYANGYAVQVCKGDMPDVNGNKKCSGKYC